MPLIHSSKLKFIQTPHVHFAYLSKLSDMSLSAVVLEGPGYVMVGTTGHTCHSRVVVWFCVAHTVYQLQISDLALVVAVSSGY